MSQTLIIKSEKLADRWEIVALRGTLKTRFNGPSDGLGPVFVSWEMGNSWSEPFRVVAPERFAMPSTANTAVRPAFNPSWVRNFVAAGTEV